MQVGDAASNMKDLFGILPMESTTDRGYQHDSFQP
jgi:hypothetical protein